MTAPKTIFQPVVQEQPASKPYGKKLRGFAAMDPLKQQRIASAGGKAAQASGNARRFTSEQASEAARKSHVARGHKVASQETQ